MATFSRSPTLDVAALDRTLLALLPRPQLRRKTRNLVRMAAPNLEQQQSDANKAKDKTAGVLFVCLGNICRSPAAEAVFRRCVEKRGLESRYDIDSAGTIDYHEGNPADARMREAARKRGIAITSISRPICPSDFEKFDHILAMDKRNRSDILKAYKSWKGSSAGFPSLPDGQVKLICDFCREQSAKEVPDPYYGGPAGFEKVLDLLEDACEGLLDALLADAAATS